LSLRLTAFDLGVLHKEDKEMGIGESLKLSAFYIGIALLFGAWVWAQKGADLGMKYYTGFFIEKALSIDNVFVISLIFTYFAIPRMYQYRALLWGIIAVIVLRGIMIAAGAAVVQQYYWVLYVFAAFLIATGVKMLFAGDKPMDVANNPAVKFISRHMRVTPELHAQHFFVRVTDEKTGRLVRAATPLFLALVVINLADLVFAVDSVPAIFAITTDTFIVYTPTSWPSWAARALLRARGHGAPLPLPEVRARARAGVHRVEDLRLRFPARRRQIPAGGEPRGDLRTDRGRHRLLLVEDQGRGGAGLARGRRGEERVGDGVIPRGSEPA
jgi:tellurite resistance protein TerC